MVLVRDFLSLYQCHFCLEKLGCQNFNSRSVKGLESRFESILLAYSVLLSRAQRRFEGTLRYSLGY